MLTIKPLRIPLYGPIAVHGYGITLLIALFVFYWLVARRLTRLNIMSSNDVAELTTHGIIVGLIGSRLLHFISEHTEYDHWTDIFAIWHGGFSILGAIIAAAIYIPYALKRRSIPILAVIDVGALYAPLGHAIGRLGCLWAGCCFGCPAEIPFGVSYTGTTAGAPIGIMLHATPLYSAFACLAIFVLIRYVIMPRARIAGTVFASYLIGMGLERFSIDFWRNDRILQHADSLLSVNQWLALGLVIFGCGLLVYNYFILRKKL